MNCKTCAVEINASNTFFRWGVRPQLCSKCEGTQFATRQTPEFRQSTLEQALLFASKGMYILPLHNPELAGGAIECSCRCRGWRVGKHLRVQTSTQTEIASNNERDIRQWFTQWPDMNFAIACSPSFGVIGLDIDFSYEGEKHLPEVEAKLGPLMDHALVVDSPNGFHLYFKHPGTPELADFHNVVPGVDVRARDSYLIAPPSLSATGAVYTLRGQMQNLQPLPNPAALVELMEQSEGFLYDPNILRYPTPGDPLPSGWIPGLKGKVK